MPQCEPRPTHVDGFTLVERARGLGVPCCCVHAGPSHARSEQGARQQRGHPRAASKPNDRIHGFVFDYPRVVVWTGNHEPHGPTNDLFFFGAGALECRKPTGLLPPVEQAPERRLRPDAMVTSVLGYEGGHRGDCFHPCLPGLPDFWNEMLFNLLPAAPANRTASGAWATAPRATKVLQPIMPHLSKRAPAAG